MMTSAAAKRERDAEVARLSILDAAEQIFAENGFDGARIDAIAELSGYNKSLIFHYFEDKLGLYTEVMRRADSEMSVMQTGVLVPLLSDETILNNPLAFKRSLETIVGATFDYLADHPRLMRMLVWEQAENWQTYAKIISRFNTDDAEPFRAFFRKARQAGLLRFDFDPLIQLTLVLQICISYLTYIPLLQMVQGVVGPDENLSSAAALARAREYIVAFVVHGMMVDFPETES